MAKIRFEDVTITAKAIEIEGVEDPSALLQAFGLDEAAVDAVTEELAQKEEEAPVEVAEEIAPPIVEEPPVVEAKEVKEEPPKKKKSPRRKSKPRKRTKTLSEMTDEEFADSMDNGVPMRGEDGKLLPEFKTKTGLLSVKPEQLLHAKRLRDVVQVFMDAGVSDTEDIVERCADLSDDVPILKRLLDVRERMAICVDKWNQENG